MNIKVSIKISLAVFLLLCPASLGESIKAPKACDGELVLLNKLQEVKTPQVLRAKIQEAQKLVLPGSLEWSELSDIAQAAKKAGPSQVPALKTRLIALLEQKCVDKD
jgi:hypothetical protein